MSNNMGTTVFSSEKRKLLEETGILEFKNRLSLVLEGLSGNAFAKKVEMSEAVIRDYLSGKTFPSLNRLAQIAKKCDIPVEWLATGKGDCRLCTDVKKPKIIYISTYESPYIEKSQSNNKHKVPFDLSYIKDQNLQADDLYVYKARGDSMMSTIANGDTLIINIASNKPLDGYIYVIQYGEALSLKRIQNHDKYFLLISDNDKYPPIQIDKSNLDNDFQIIGRVIAIFKDLS